jgi:hypothetical protein
MGLIDDLGQLTSSEIAVVASRPLQAPKIKEDSLKAIEETKKRYPDAASRLNGPGDAFRHCYWAALLTRDLGSNNARDFTDAHEMLPGNPRGEREMDHHNNTQGILIGIRNPHATDDVLISECEAALKSGKLKLHP